MTVSPQDAPAESHIRPVEPVGIRRYKLRRGPERLASEAKMKRLTAAEELARLQKAHDALLGRLKDRANDPAMRGVPGGSTGLLVRTEHRVAGGNTVRVAYQVDSDMIGALLRVHERARRIVNRIR